jgi:hypothetical protein
MHIDRVRLAISGGVAGLLRRAEMAGAELAPEERHALESHAERGGAVRPDDGARDLLTYQLEIHAGDDVRCVTFDELSTPHDLAPLVRRLSAQSRPVKR